MTQAEQQYNAAAGLELSESGASGIFNPNALAIRRPFDPTAHELDANFRLTRFADLKGRGCKVPQEVLLKLLEGIQDDGAQDYSLDDPFGMQSISAIPRIGIGMDSSITPLRHGGLSLVQTTDFFLHSSGRSIYAGQDSMCKCA
jgi:hypothetical protein